MVVQGISGEEAQVFLCREDIRVEGAGKAGCLHTLYDWGATVTLVTHAAAERAGLKRMRQPAAAIAGLGGRCTMVDSYYMVRVVDGDDKVRSVKALGVDHIAMLAATDVPTDIGRRLPQAKGFEGKLARPAGDVEMLIGMDNQGWMPKHMGSSQVEGDNLRLMQSMLSPDGTATTRARRSSSTHCSTRSRAATWRRYMPWSESSTERSCRSKRSGWCRSPDVQRHRRSSRRTAGFRAVRARNGTQSSTTRS
jgi:hypothetical protein